MNGCILAGSLIEFLSNIWIIIAIIILVAGSALGILSKTISTKITKRDFDKTSKIYKNLLLVSLIILLIGILIFMVGTAFLAGLF